MAIGNVLVATDFSAYARIALDRALALPLADGASIELFHVLAPERDPDRAASLEAEARDALERARALALQRIPSPGMHDVFIGVGWGAPFAVIADRAHHTRAELVVLGRHGERRFRDALIGTTAERVIRHGSVPVLVVAHPAETPYRRPLVAVDLSDASRRALELAARICEPTATTIDVVHVVTVASAAPDRGAEAHRAYEELAKFAGADQRWNLVLRYGEPRTILLEEAKQRRSDLVALGAHGHTAIARALVGSVAEGVLRASASDVLIA
jgi:nucleotide-binding universal stress UspA family protein